jgi:hypothetical protein
MIHHLNCMADTYIYEVFFEFKIYHVHRWYWNGQWLCTLFERAGMVALKSVVKSFFQRCCWRKLRDVCELKRPFFCHTLCWIQLPALIQENDPSVGKYSSTMEQYGIRKTYDVHPYMDKLYVAQSHLQSSFMYF